MINFFSLSSRSFFFWVKVAFSACSAVTQLACMYSLEDSVFGLYLPDLLLWSVANLLSIFPCWLVWCTGQSISTKSNVDRKAVLKWLHHHGSLGILQIIWSPLPPRPPKPCKLFLLSQGECVPLEHGNCILFGLVLNKMNYFYNWWVQVVWGHLIRHLMSKNKIYIPSIYLSIYIQRERERERDLKKSLKVIALCSVMNLFVL